MTHEPDNGDSGVLVVDDDPEIRDGIVELLREEGHEAFGAVHGGQALEKLAAGPRPSLILLDLMMPVMDGVAFRAKQLEDPEIADIPVAVISAFRDVEETAKALGAKAVLKKPIDLSDLFEVVNRYAGDGNDQPAD